MSQKIFISSLIFQNNNYGEIKKFIEHNNIKNMEFILEPNNASDFEKTLKLLDTIKFEEVAFHGPYKTCILSDSDEENWQKALETYIQCFEIVKRYNGSYIILHTSEYHEENSDIALIKAKIIKLVELGKKYGVKVILENVGLKEEAIFSEKKYFKFLKDEKYQTVLDIGHAEINGWNIFDIMKENSDSIFAYHLHTNDGELDLHQSIRKNDFNINKFLDILKRGVGVNRLVLEYSPSVEKKTLISDFKFLNTSL